MTNPRHLHEQASKMFDIDACGRCEVCSKLNVHTKLRRNPLLLRGMSNVDTCKGIFDIDSVYFRKKNERLSQPCANSIARRACHHAQELSEKLRRSEVEHRMFGKTVKAGVVAPFTQSEIQLGRIIGLGGFSSVYEIEKIRLNQAISDSLSDQEKVAREFIAANLYHDSPTIFFETPRFVVKHVSTRLASSQESFQRAALNLVAEGVLLKTMDHPNIISLRGCTAGGPDSYRNLDPRAYFLILDYLEETLDARMDRWNQLLIKYRRRRSLPWFRRKYDIKIRNLHKERLQVLYEVACAIEYVHTQRIVHGDIKTMNIGFDESGRTKIFDFGLAQVLPHDDSQNGSCVFSLPCVGTVSYMAPEVRSKKPYGLSADVYSFGFVLWEVFSLGSPSEELLFDRRLNEQDYAVDTWLHICPFWPMTMQNLIRRTLSFAPENRPTIHEIVEILKQEIASLSFESSCDVARRRGPQVRFHKPVDKSKPSVTSNLSSDGDIR